MRSNSFDLKPKNSYLTETPDLVLMSTQIELLVETFQALNRDLVVLGVLEKYVN